MEFLALLDHMDFLKYQDELWLAPKRNDFDSKRALGLPQGFEVRSS
jgi:hypothetical protein